ncbi:MAG TPA: hypothetical protein VF600_15250 [Abditibacteriaceae bacterium]|jgi:hypothetical protein
MTQHIWHDGAISGVGPRALWERRAAWTGVLCSRRVPASLILAAQDWANDVCRGGVSPPDASRLNTIAPDAIATTSATMFSGCDENGRGNPAPTVGYSSASEHCNSGTNDILVSGWQSPVEQEIFRIALREGAPIVGVASRELTGARLSPVWREAVDAGAMTVISPFKGVARLTRARARERNMWILTMCSRIVVPHAAPDGELHALLMSALITPVAPRIEVFDHPLHAALIENGAHVL